MVAKTKQLAEVWCHPAHFRNVNAGKGSLRLYRGTPHVDEVNVIKTVTFLLRRKADEWWSWSASFFPLYSQIRNKEKKIKYFNVYVSEKNSSRRLWKPFHRWEGVRWITGDYVNAERRNWVSSSVSWDKSLCDATLYNLFLPLWLSPWLLCESNDRSEKIMGLKCDEKNRWKNKRCLHLFSLMGSVDASVWENLQTSATIAVIYSDPEITDTLNDLYYNVGLIKYNV